MRSLLRLAVLLGSVAAAALAGAGSPAGGRPNIVFLLTDDQATYTLGCYGNPDVSTPNLDRLAKDGMVFDNHYDTTAICMASRASIMTGMFEYRTGCNFEHGSLLRGLWKKSYPVLLREAGYRTAFAGKFGFEVAEEPGEKGGLPEGDFDRWGGGPGQTSYETVKNKSMAKYAAEYPHSTRSYGAFGRDFIAEAAAGDQPFCLSISFKAPHQPDTPDPVFDAIYAGKSFTRPANFGRENGRHFSEQSRQGRQFERFETWNYDKDYDGVMARYHQQVYGVDVAVGMIRDALREHGVEKNTVLIFTSDNGFFCGAHGYGSKVLPYEEASRVPLIVFDPRHANSGRELRCDALTGNVDFAPTILNLAGVPVSEDMDGRSLMPLYANREAAIHESLPLINVWGPQECHSLAIVTRDLKYIYWNYGEGDFKPVEELYHLGNDPLELANAATNPEYRAQLESMRALYDRAVDTWKQEAVPYHGYAEFGVIFDRNLPWEKKRGHPGGSKKQKQAEAAPAPAPLAAETPGQDASEGLPKGDWKAVALGGKPAPEGLLLKIEGDRLGGYSGCNSFNGKWSLDGATLKIGPLMSTRRACPPPEMETERRVHEALGNARGFRVDGRRLAFLGDGGTALIEYERE